MKPGLGIHALLFVLGAAAMATVEAGSLPARNAEPADAASVPAVKDEPAPLFEKLDADNDGYVTKQEAKHAASVFDRFKEFDTDHDGKLSLPEYKKGMQPKVL